MSGKIIIDSDMAFGSPYADIDDSLAILTAFALGLDVIGVNAVGGNVSADKASRNIDNLLKRIGRGDVMHSFSSSEPLDPTLWVHERWSKSVEEKVDRKSYPSLPDSVTALRREIDSVPDKVTIVTIGPMTNLASFIRTFPDYIPRIEAVYSMGGTINMPGVGNGPAEFNIKADPEAAEIVFSSLPVTLFPLDVTKKKKIYPETIEKWSDQKGLIHDLYEASVSFMDYRAKRDGYTPSYAFYHDVLPIVGLVHPEYFSLLSCSVSVELNSGLTKGVTVVDRRGGNCRVAVDVDSEAVFSFVENELIRAFGGAR